MDLEALFDRISAAVDQQAYLPYADAVPPEQQEAMSLVQAALQDPDTTGSQCRTLAERLHEDGRIDKVMLFSALHVIAASPKVNDFEEAARLVGQQELAAWDRGGPDLDHALASVERHRGVLAYLKGNHRVALDYFTRAFERQRSPGNLANVLATLLSLGEEREAQELYRRIRRTFPEGLVAALSEMVQVDPDLQLLRSEGGR